MSEGNIEDPIKSSIEIIRDFGGVENIIGTPINTASGVTVIPISTVSFAFINGGYDASKRISSKGSGTAGGSAASVKPMGFLTVSKDGQINVFKMNDEISTADKLIDVIDRSPDILKAIKSILT